MDRATPNHTLAGVIRQETMSALRCGMPLESVIATLIHQAETLQMALPVVIAMRDAQGSPL